MPAAAASGMSNLSGCRGHAIRDAGSLSRWSAPAMTHPDRLGRRRPQGGVITGLPAQGCRDGSSPVAYFIAD